MSVMGPDGKIFKSDGNWWSPYGDTDKEIKKNMRLGKMPNAPDVICIRPKHITGSRKKDKKLLDMLGSIGALAGPAKEEYDNKILSKKINKI